MSDCEFSKLKPNQQINQLAKLNQDIDEEINQ